MNRDLGKYQEAVQDFGLYIKHNAMDGDGFYQRGLAEQQLAQKPAALADLKQALKLYQIAGDDDGAKNATDAMTKLGGT